MRIISRQLTALSAIAAGIVALASTAHAQNAPYQYPVGSANSCGAQGTTATQLGGYSSTIPYQGQGTFQTISNSEDDSQPASTTMMAVAFEGTGQDPELGEVTWRLVPSTTVLSTITANQVSSPLPATGRLSFYAEVRVSSQPEAIYRSENPVVMVNRNITEWPHRRARYNQESTVILRNINNPAQVMMAPAMTAVVTASAQ